MTTPLYRTEAERQKAEDVFVATCLQCLAKGVGWPEQNYRNRFRDHHPVLRPTRAEVLEKWTIAACEKHLEDMKYPTWRELLTDFAREYEEATP